MAAIPAQYDPLPRTVRLDFLFARPLALTSAHRYGALTQLWAGTAASPETVNRKVRTLKLAPLVVVADAHTAQYLIPWGRVGAADPRCNNEATQRALYVWLEEQVEGF